jgi:Bifunctional DNA primase/polymerase, N-terminal/Protein of unknown function (DUF3987)
MSSSRHIIKIAKKYRSWGWLIVPVPPKKKGPRLNDWQKLRLGKSEIPQYFDARDNIGILLGKPSKGLVDIDLDCEQSIFLAPHFLPKTRKIHGRKSKPNSHYWYRCHSIPAPEKFCDIDNICLVEIRSTGQQTIVPPSVHPSGELVHWFAKGRSGRVKKAELESAVRRLAAATLISRHWPHKGSRNDASLALAGMLLNSGWEEAAVEEFVSLVAQAANDEESKARKSAARATRKRIDKGSTFVGRPSLEKLLGATVVDRACEWLGIGGTTTSPVMVRSSAAAWPKSLSKRAYCSLVGDVVRAIGPTTEADEAGLLVQFLIGFGSAIGRTAHFRVGSAIHYTNLYGVLVGQTAKSRKGTSWAEIRYLLEAADPVWSSRCVLQGGLASGEGLTWAVRDPITKGMKPKKGTVRDKETLKIVDEGISDKRLLVIETEFGSPLRVIRREGNTLAGIIRCAWDRGDLVNLSKISPARATGAHISIIGHITRDELLHEFKANDGSNGFANRFLWVCVRRSQFCPIPKSLPPETFNPLVKRLRDALAFARRAAEMRFSKQALKLWFIKYEELGEEVPGLLGAITSRPEPQVLRISAIYALLNHSNFIERKHLRAALEVWRYCEDSARYIFGDKFGHPVIDRILQHLRKEPKGLTRTEIRELFNRNRTELEINNALRTLQENNFARCSRQETGGRPSERWFAVR